MKRIFLILSVSIGLLTSCTPTKHIKTATTKDVALTVTSDLEISSEKISYMYHHLYSYGGDINEMKENAVSNALKEHGDADLLIAPQFDIKSNASSAQIIVTGYPAKYKNLRSISLDGEISEAQKTNINGTQSVVVSKNTESTVKQGSQTNTSNGEDKDKDVKKSSLDKQCELGVRYLNGEGVTKDVAVALKYLKEAAKQGHAKAQYELGCYYWSERENMGYTMMAEKWISKAAEQGYAPAVKKLKEIRE